MAEQRNEAPAAGLAVSFTSGSRLWLRVTAGLAPGATVEGANTPVIGSALEHITLPALFDDTGKSSPPSRGLYRSVLTKRP